MRPRPSSLLRSLLAFWLSIFLVTSLATAQPSPSVAAVEPRITRAVDEAQLATLKGNTHPLARTQFDRGAASPTLPLDRMLLVLKRSPEQDAALITLLDQQQDKSSPNYHKWLTPEEFGKHFGPADSDIQAVTAWLQTHGFQVDQVSKGRTVIEFSGTAAMVEEAFHTQIHRYVVKGESHWANASDPQIPEAVTPVVSGVWSLHNFLKKPLLRMSDEHFPLIHPAGATHPFATSSSGAHFLSPGDFAVIYGINPAYQAGADGTGTSIAVLARSDFNPGDLSDFRNAFGLSPLTLFRYYDGPNPGDLGGGEEAEAVLDITWAGAVAPNTTILSILSASTNTTDGVDLSEVFAINNNLGDVITESFGSCEATATSAEISGLGSLAEQAAAQGMTYVVSTGDTGSAGCDNLAETTATGPVSINVLASTPFNVAVGGTIFNENGHDSSYWSQNTSVPVTALKYIPEDVWNESCTSGTCGNNANIAAGGGGPSSVVPKPNWQSGSNLHIPADSFRDVPDVSLTAALHDPYLICLAGSCSQQGFLVGISGTSASAPSFAGIMALVDSKMVQLRQRLSGRVGLANYVLYRLANSEMLLQCNASSTSTPPASSCVFNDVTVGNNAVPGEASYGSSSPKFTATVGYDLATGLGSVQVSNLINSWSAVSYTASSTSLALTPTPTNIVHGTAVQANITVTPGSGSVKPTGDVSLIATLSSGLAQGIGSFQLTNGTATGTTRALPGGLAYNVSAHYAGDATFAPSDSPSVPVTINPEPSSTSATVLSADATGKPIPFTAGPYGTFVYLRADVKGQSGFGVPTGDVSFSDNTAFVDLEGLNSQGNTNTPHGIFTFAPGSHAITATYEGDFSFDPSTSSPAVNFTIAKASTTTSLQTTTGTTVGIGATVALTVTVSTSSRGLPPSGSVAFFDGNAQLGNAGIVGGIDPQSGLAYGTATFQTTSLLNGQHPITAQYPDDTNYTGSSSSAVTVTVAPDYSLTFTGNANTTISAPGGSLALTLAVVGQTGYTGTVVFAPTACSGLPLYTTCAFNPPSVQGSGSTTLSIATTAPHVVREAGGVAVRAMLGGIGLWAVVVLGFAPRKRRWSSVFSLLVFAWLLCSIGCGGSGGGGHTPGTPLGSYPVTVTANDGTFQRTVNFTLTVQ